MDERYAAVAWTSVPLCGVCDEAACLCFRGGIYKETLELIPIDGKTELVHNGYMNGFNCPLCGAVGEIFHQHYQHCQNCDLIALHPDHYLSPEEEKAQYDLHQNSPDDLAYREFLNQLCVPLMTLKPAPAKLLDFGSGPGPTLALMMEEQGYLASNYDVFYAPDKNVLNDRYDIITMTEVLEHLSQPLVEVERLVKMLTKQGLLGVMTALHTGVKKFPDWHYKNDPTHICFFSEQSIKWLADAAELELELLSSRVMIFRKNYSSKT